MLLWYANKIQSVSDYQMIFHTSLKNNHEICWYIDSKKMITNLFLTLSYYMYITVTNDSNFISMQIIHRNKYFL